MRLGIAEILKLVNQAPSREEKIEILKINDSAVLKTILKYALDPKIEWELPKGKVPYEPNPYVDQQGNLYTEARRLYLFVKGGHPTLKQMKREILFIQFLEGLDAEDAKVIVAAKDKKLPVKGLTVKLVNKAFPGLIEE